MPVDSLEFLLLLLGAWLALRFLNVRPSAAVAAFNVGFLITFPWQHIMALASFLLFSYFVSSLAWQDRLSSKVSTALILIAFFGLFLMHKLEIAHNSWFKTALFSFAALQVLAYAYAIIHERHPPLSFTHFLATSIFFCNLTAGPVESLHDLAKLTDKAAADLSSLRGHLFLLASGLFKKTLADQIFGMREIVETNMHGLTGSWLWVILQVAWIYADFSGYTDIARGAAGSLGIPLKENFTLPYLARSPLEFWRRWHMSLGDWFRTYVYIPLSKAALRWTRLSLGPRFDRFAIFFSIWVTFVLIALWHELSWRFFIWSQIVVMAIGANHIVASLFPRAKIWFGIFSTFVMVILAHTFAHGSDSPYTSLKTMMALLNWSSAPSYSPITWILALSFLVVPHACDWLRLNPSRVYSWVGHFVVLLQIYYVLLAKPTSSPFLYGQF